MNYIEYNEYTEIKPFLEFKKPKIKLFFFFITYLWTSIEVNGGNILYSILFVIIFWLLLIPVAIILDLCFLLLIGIFYVLKYFFNLVDYFVRRLIDTVLKSVFRPVLFVSTIIIILIFLIVCYKLGYFSDLYNLMFNFLK